MLSNRAKRNIRLTLVILSGLTIIDRSIRIAMGELDWWQLVSVIIITAFCIKFYLCYQDRQSVATSSEESKYSDN